MFGIELRIIIHGNKAKLFRSGFRVWPIYFDTRYKHLNFNVYPEKKIT